jgi:hypothetical protein
MRRIPVSKSVMADTSPHSFSVLEVLPQNTAQNQAELINYKALSIKYYE